MSEAAQVAAQKTIYCPELAPFEKIYRDIHRNPELSLQEVHTATLVVEFLESLGGYQVIKEIGGHGYASTRIVKSSDGKETPVMHACGHDMHTAVLLADAKMLLDAKSEWSGTLIVLFQPAEELAVGARATIEDGLYDPSKFAVTKPDIVLGLKTHAFKAGMIALGGGTILTAVDSFDVRSRHICRADLCVDPVVTASHIVVRLQSIITKEVRPEGFAVIRCASIHGGSTANIIPDF
ncbi:uncharacterized protein EAF01_002481 [Botrytis porri]|uniref:uncharacterized protein n=1 Tax=Botrytis porri TaxID=87229 RepID=UPI0019027578|nr:uncharacterized protein EAF01_002481 [Botrytis porri]KAF7910973.1 hypothetical protein EAF01_002481 [Botrytis porri]